MCFTRNFEIKRQGNSWTKQRASTSYLIFPLTFQYPASLKQCSCGSRGREIQSDWVASDIYFESWKQYYAFTVQSFFKLNLSLWTFPAFFLSGDKTISSFAHIYFPVMLHNCLKVSHTRFVTAHALVVHLTTPVDCMKGQQTVKSLMVWFSSPSPKKSKHY